MERVYIMINQSNTGLVVFDEHKAFGNMFLMDADEVISHFTRLTNAFPKNKYVILNIKTLKFCTLETKTVLVEE